MKLIYFSVLILFFAVSSYGLNILAILPLSMKSHFAIGNSIVKSLLDVGHNVTTITMFKPDKPIDNYRVIPVPDTMNSGFEADMNPLDFAEMPIWLSSFMMPWMGAEMTNDIMKSEELKEFLADDNEKFDICIMEIFATESLLGIVEKYNCVLVQYTTFDAFIWIDKMSGGTSPISYVPHPWLEYTDKMTFKQRLHNGLFTLFDDILHYILHVPWQKYLYWKYFPNAKRSFNEMFKNGSITFINHHVSHSFPRPHQSTDIEIGGIHVKPAKALPDDLQKFMDSATEGVVFFSMGSYIDGTNWPVETREMFIRVLGSLKQKVLWRYSNETLPNNPGNIKIGSWFPQRDILAHKNLKVFITHGGLLGTTEALVEGVPILGIPIFGDQMMNMAKAVARGYGLQMGYKEIAEDKMKNLLNELLSNSKYKETAERVSKSFNDRPMTPQETVVYWTEYAFRHHGAAHLKAQSVNMNFIEYNSIDVYFVLLIGFAVIFYISFKILKIVLKLFKKGDKKKKNQ